MSNEVASNARVTDDPVEREKLFQRWWKASKYCQVIYPEPHLEQYARDGFEAGLEAALPSGVRVPDEARMHAVALEQCAIFAADAGSGIAKCMAEAAAFLRNLSATPQEGSEHETPMDLSVALDFADNPRTYHSLQATADTNGELYEALRVLAAAYRSATAQPVATGAAMIAQMSDEEFGRDRSDENPMVGKPAPAPDELEVVGHVDDDDLARMKVCPVVNIGIFKMPSGRKKNPLVRLTDATRLLNQEMAEKARLERENAGLRLAHKHSKAVASGYPDRLEREIASTEAAEARVAELKKALSGLIERYEEIVEDDTIGRGLRDHDLVAARAALSEGEQ